MRTRSFLIASSWIALALVAGCSTPPAPGPRPTSVRPLPVVSPTPNPALVSLGSLRRDVTYCTPGKLPLKMDLYFPKTVSRPAPLVVYVHGGAWSMGDKADGEEALQVPEFVRRGYIVASLDYRLAPQYKWPAQIQDVKCAIRYLRANAALYGLDPNRIGAVGSSAGGQLVALLGLADPSAGFDTGEYLDQSSAVQVVVDMFGPSDLTSPGFLGQQAQLARDVFGVTSLQDPILVQASPVTFVSPDAPPFLILHGDKDTLVPPAQSKLLYDRLQAAHVASTLVVVKNAEHGFAPSGGSISPTREQIVKSIADFVDKVLLK